MKIEIEIPDDELKEKILEEVARRLTGEFGHDAYRYKRLIQECVREVIYKDKENIVDRVVDQASRECRNKAVKKMTAMLLGGGNEE